MNMQQNFREMMLKSGQLSGGNLEYVENLFESWLADPASVPAEWSAYFNALPHGAGPNSNTIPRVVRYLRIFPVSRK